MLMQLQEAENKMGLTILNDTNQPVPKPKPSKAWSKSWAMLMARIFEVLPLLCPRCQSPMKVVSFITDPPVVKKILVHLELSYDPPVISQARGPPQLEFDMMDQSNPYDAW